VQNKRNKKTIEKGIGAHSSLGNAPGCGKYELELGVVLRAKGRQGTAEEGPGAKPLDIIDEAR
jgi:hypothetical protein